MNLVLIKIAKEKKIKKKIEIINKVKELCKKQKQYIKLVKENNEDIDFIDGVAIKFCEDIDTTAKTINGDVFLNYKLFDSNIKKILRYVIHELVHVFQHIKNEGKKQKKEKGHYLQNKDEVEAFKVQLEYMDEEEGKDISKYLEDLLDFHKIKDKKRRKDIVDSLVDDLDDGQKIKKRLS